MRNTVWLRSWFGILASYSRPLVYFDNASTTQKPSVISNVFSFVNFKACANLARGKYFLSSKLDSLYALSRRRVLLRLHAGAQYECIVYKSATEALNRVCLGLKLNANFNAVVSITEHHSGLMPWFVAERDWGINVNVIGLSCDHVPNIEQYLALTAKDTHLVLISHMSNILGALVPIRLYVSACAHTRAVSVIDGAQAASHFKLNLLSYNCTEYVLAAHKLYGPAGVGIGIGKRTLFDALAPVFVGGGSVNVVSANPRAYTLASLPFKHEAGSPMSFGLISLGVLIGWRYKLGFGHEAHLLRYLWSRLFCIKRISILNTYLPSTRLLSFGFEFIQADDVCAFLNKLSVCIRAGAHCAMPLIAYFGKRSMCRASVAAYNTYKDADALSFGLSYLGVLS
ncbi:MAG: aminotransferase class V-fold PLP-dependent enzyme [Candidatus Hodgkinia cicadicola]